MTFLNAALIASFIVFAVLLFAVIIGIGLKKNSTKKENVENNA